MTQPNEEKVQRDWDKYQKELRERMSKEWRSDGALKG